VSRHQKDHRKLIRRARDQGWCVRPTRDGHRLLSPDGEVTVILHTSESDRRALLNTRARLRRGGLRI
jgi:hypothetical protein